MSVGPWFTGRRVDRGRTHVGVQVDLLKKNPSVGVEPMQWEREQELASSRRIERDAHRDLLAWVDHSVFRLDPSGAACSMHTHCGSLAQATRPTRAAPRSLLVTLRLPARSHRRSRFTTRHPHCRVRCRPVLRYATDAFSSDNCRVGPRRRRTMDVCPTTKVRAVVLDRTQEKPGHRLAEHGATANLAPLLCRLLCYSLSRSSCVS
jgi:hypothetical protein